MQDVFRMSRAPRRARAARRFAYVPPTLVATVVAALILHLLSELASRADLADPATLLSVLVGTAGVLVTLMPFAVLFALRARHAWMAALPPPETRNGRPSGPAVASGSR